MIEKEHIIYQETLRNNPYLFKKLETIEEHLVLMQHHGIPTRLLDITSNPLVALFFACQPHEKKTNGKVFYFIENTTENKYSIQGNAKFTTLISGPISFDTFMWHFEYYESEEDQCYRDTKEIIKERHNIENSMPHCVLFRPKKTNRRIIAQSGDFFIFGHLPFQGSTIDEIYKNINPKMEKIQNPKPIPKLINNRISHNQGEIIIPNSAKEIILKELDTLNINHSTLFPDLSGWADYMKWRYK